MKIPAILALVVVGLSAAALAEVPADIRGVADTYAAKDVGNVFKSIQLLGTPSKPLARQKYYRYKAVRSNGRADSGVWWFADMGKDEGYLHFESGKRKFFHGKRVLQLAVYFTDPCSMQTRPTVGPKWNRAPTQDYTRARCQKKKPALRPVSKKAQHAYLDINSVPWAKVVIDGRKIGNTPVIKHKVRPGRHTIRLENTARRLAQSRTVVVEAGERKKLTFRLGK